MFLTILVQLAKMFEVLNIQSKKAIISELFEHESKQTLPLTSLQIFSALAADSFQEEGVIALIFDLI